MNELDVLESEYPGDGAWKKFAALFLPEWAKRPDKSKYVLELEDEAAAVIASELGDEGPSWFGRSLDALGGRSPREVMRDHPNGKTIVRSLIMRMPR